jgi:hypothetical protein
MIKPVKVIFEMEQANPHLVIIETYSQPISNLKPFTAQMARNILVQLAYLIQRVLSSVAKDPSIYRPLL